jgi:hypothetical protein
VRELFFGFCGLNLTPKTKESFVNNKVILTKLHVF